MDLVPITPESHGVALELRYAGPDNITGRPIYGRAACYLHRVAADHLARAVALARVQGLGIKVFDAFRPQEAQRVLWAHTPDPEFLTDPRRGSPHSRGVAVDLTLVGADGRDLDMGTGFDDFSPRAHHGNTDVSALAQRNRYLLLGIMTAAGWDCYLKEWWHYQLFDARTFPLIADSALGEPLMPG